MEQKPWLSQTAKGWLFTSSQNLPLCVLQNFTYIKHTLLNSVKKGSQPEGSTSFPGSWEIMKSWSSTRTDAYLVISHRITQRAWRGGNTISQLVSKFRNRSQQSQPEEKPPFQQYPWVEVTPFPPGYPFTAQTLFPASSPHPAPAASSGRPRCSQTIQHNDLQEELAQTWQ